MAITPPDVPEIKADEKHADWAAHALVHIRSAWLIIATLLAILTFINAQMPATFAPDTFIGKAFRGTIDYVFDRPALTRANAAIDANSGRDGFAYFETNADGTPTSDGRLVLVSGRPVLFSELKPGALIRANDGVNIRANPTSQSQLVSILGAGECAVRVDGEDEKVTELGGWIPIKRSPCG